MKKLTALFLALLLVFTMAGCGNQTEENVTPTPTPAMESAEADVSGSSVGGETPDMYAATEVSDSPVIATYKLSAANYGNGEVTGIGLPAIQIVLQEDGTGIYGDANGQMNIVWTQEGDQYTLISQQLGPNDPLVLTADGDNLIAVYGEQTMTFQKQQYWNFVTKKITQGEIK